MTINLTAGTGVTGQYGIQTQTTDLQGNSSGWGTVGTWTIAAPFALTISPPQFIPAGGTASFTITASSAVAGQPINLAWLNPNTGPPNYLPGFACQVGVGGTSPQYGYQFSSPTVITGGAPVTATITTTTSGPGYNPLNTYIYICDFLVGGSYAALSATPQEGQINLTASPVYSFPPPATETILPGNSVYFPLTVTSSNGFAGTVTISGTVASSCGITVTNPPAFNLPSNGTANPSLYVSVPIGCASQNYTLAISSLSSPTANSPSQNATLTVSPAVTVTPLPAATSMTVDGSTYYSATSFPVGSHTLASASSGTRSGALMAYKFFDGVNTYQTAVPPLDGPPAGTCPWGCSGGQCSTPLPPVLSPAPTISSITGFLQSGGASTITINGNNFGTVAGLLGFCPWGASPCLVTPTDGTPMSYGYTSWTNTQIVATITLPDTVTEADWGVYVISDAWISGSDAENPDDVEVPVEPPVPPTLSVTANQAPVAANSTVWISATPAMPALVASLVAPPGTSLQGTATWQIVFSYQAGSYVWSCSVPGQPLTQSASLPWSITAGMSGICGGTATLTVSYAGAAYSFSFTVLGQNPTSGAVRAALGNSPWFLQQLVNLESGYAQFMQSGNPNFGPPNGFGVMQLDPPDSTYQIWDWTQNIPAGVSRLNAFNAAATWAGYVAAWNAYNLANSPQIIAPTDQQEGPCVFSFNPSGGSYPFSDALWIKRYNSGYANPYIQFQQFTDSGGNHGLWIINDLNGQNVDYVQVVCSKSQ